MSYLLPHLHSGFSVDQAILAEEDRVVCIRFGHDWDETCMQMDEILASTADAIKNFAVIYLVDIGEVPDFNTMYELYDPCTCMFFFRNKHIMMDLGTGNNNKINWAMSDKGEFIDIVEVVYRGARKGRGLVCAILCNATRRNLLLCLCQTSPERGFSALAWAIALDLGHHAWTLRNDCAAVLMAFSLNCRWLLRRTTPPSTATRDCCKRAGASASNDRGQADVVVG